MKFNPLQDRVVIKRTDPNTKSSGGIIIPDVATEKSDQGTVLAVGPGKRTQAGDVIPMTVSVGDRVLFGKFAGQAVKINGEEVVILNEEEIYGIIEGV